nr:hypothetical protein [Tanacetum cinerariifolium]
MTELPLVNSGLFVLVFYLGDDPIACLSKAMTFLTDIASLRFPSTNNQLRTFSNPRNQDTIQDGKDKAMLAEAKEAGKFLDKEQLAFLIDPGIPDGQAVQIIIPNNAAFQNEDLDTYDSDCDDVSNAKAILMANISNYGSDVISECGKISFGNRRLCKEINHVKHVFKDQFDSIKKTRVRTKEQCDSLIDKLNLKSVENEDLKAQIQDKVFVITSLRNDLRKVKGKEIVDIATQIPSANTIIPGMFKLDLEPLAPRSKPTSNKKNDKISQTPSRNMKNRVEAQPRKVNKKNQVVNPICYVDVKHS